jgi:uncharacterized coiled-coil protein SlyX
MTKKPSKDDALEALDFIINVLKEHEKDLDRLINELGKITERLGDTEEISEKVAKVEERLESLQNEVSNLISFLSAHPQTTLESSAASTVTAIESTSKTVPAVASSQVRGPPVILRCKQWEDFKTLASHAETVSFLYKEADRTFQVDALKNGRIITYSGELPKSSELLKTWLTSELGIAETDILEGVLAIG